MKKGFFDFFSKKILGNEKSGKKDKHRTNLSAANADDMRADVEMTDD